MTAPNLNMADLKEGHTPDSTLKSYGGEVRDIYNPPVRGMSSDPSQNIAPVDRKEGTQPRSAFSTGSRDDEITRSVARL